MAACTSGGEIGSGGNAVNQDDPDAPVDPDDPDAPPAVTVASVDLIVSSTDLRSDADTGPEGVTLTALVKDANNNAIQNQTVTFTTDSGLIQVTQGTTDAAGSAQAIVTTGGDAGNRVINARASAGNQADTLQINVTGTTLSINGPSSIGDGDTVTYALSLLNAGSEGIGNEALGVTSQNGNTLSSASLTTNSNGSSTFQLTGDVPGTDVLTATGFDRADGVTQPVVASQTVTVAARSLALSIDPAAGEPAFDGEIGLDEARTTRITLTANDGSSIANQDISLSSTRGALSADGSNGSFTQNALVVQTNGSGVATAVIRSRDPGDATATNAGKAGPTLITATGPGGATATASYEFVATDTNNINLQASPTTVPVNGTSEIRAVVRDADSNPVKNATVNFTLEGSTAGQLLSATAVTDSRGLATVTYQAGGTNSGSSDEGPEDENDVTVSGSVGSGAAAISDSAAITVGGQALRIAIGTGNEVEEPNTTTFIKRFTVVVTDPAGNPAPASTIFRVRLVPIGYATGNLVATDTDNPPDGDPDEFVQVVTGATASGFCVTEDTDLDGILDAGEDVNGSGQLEPFNPASVPDNLELDENGAIEFPVTYLQNHNLWTIMRLTATATVSGTESFNATTFVLPALASDLNQVEVSPPGATSPYGSDADGCNDFDR
ncbi:hypothetical protein GYB61_08810 [bacterium]|nr:hypothetical protein [bacterium]